jgi:broad specificity phosphatase PhoE
MHKNKYFLLRHGQNIHQTEKRNIVYCYPDDNPPCTLIEEGVEEAKKAGELLLNKEIDLIVCSDTLRTKQTAEIVAKIIGHEIKDIVFEERLRDKNWGIFGGGSKSSVWDYYKNDKLKAFDIAPEGGETWNDCQKRIVDVFNELEEKHFGKNILIVSHSNPLWLLEVHLNGLTNQEMLEGYKDIIKTGEVRELQ